MGRVATTASLVVLLLSACPSEPAPPPPPEKDPGACAAYGVTEAAPIPDTCPLEIAGDGDGVRVFAVGPVVRYQEMTDYAAFCTTWDTMVRTQVLPCLAEDRPNLLVFPENAALAAAFIGSRGEASRAADTTLGGFLPFFDSYSKPYAFYLERYPQVDANARLLLSLTDTLNRAFQTFPSVARTYGVWVAVSADLAPAEETTDPGAVAALADPDLSGVDSVWVATEPATYNFGTVFDPEGTRVARVAKAYLVPAEEDLLTIAHGPLTQMRPVDLPFARAGMVISKDAWMPDVLARLDALGADLMLQPEAFSGWAVEEYEGDWLPDIVKQAGWAHTQRSAVFRNNVTPCIKGNLLDMVYDGQSHVTRDARTGQPELAFVGQPPSLGFLAVEPWVVPDPGAPLTLAERRAALREVGAKLAPGSDDPLEDQYAGGVVAADLSLPADGAQPASGDGTPGVLGASRPVLAPAADGAHQRHPDLAADGSRVVVTFSEGTRSGGAVRVAVSADGGASFAAAPFFDALPAGPVRRTPRVAVAGERILVAWEQEDPATGAASVEAATGLDGGATWSAARVAGDAAEAWAPDVAVDPADGTLHVAWLDLRAGGRPKPFAARSADGASWDEVRVDPANAVTDNPRGDAAFVRVAARGGRVFVAFTDFRAYAWDVYLAESADGGASFAAAARIDPPAKQVVPAAGDPAVEAERLHGDVDLALAPDGSARVSWASLQDRRVDTEATLWSPDGVLRMDDAPARVDAFRPALAILPDGTEVAAWQDLRAGPTRLRLAARPPGAAAFAPSAVLDDAAEDAVLASPRLAPVPAGVAAVWEDWRTGRARVRLAHGGV